ncbi:MAG: hypothetical protein HYV60_12210 [Planctomycetia bacterium]|nr:hypothetical protein [Planctomycetia bacterium]
MSFIIPMLPIIPIGFLILHSSPWKVAKSSALSLSSAPAFRILMKCRDGHSTNTNVPCQEKVWQAANVTLKNSPTGFRQVQCEFPAGCFYWSDFKLDRMRALYDMALHRGKGDAKWQHVG